MSETVKLIIEIPKVMYECIQNKTYCGSLYEYLGKGIPLDDVKAEIQAKYDSIPWRYNENDDGWIEALEWVLEILDNIGKAESEE